MTTLIKSGVQINLNDFPALYPNQTGVKFADKGWSVVFPAPQGTLSNSITKRWQEGDPVLTNLGTWQQTWTEVDVYAAYTDEQGVVHTKAEQEATAIAVKLASDRSAKWLQIKSERDRRKSGGALVSDKWFHTDTDSRIQQIGLVLMGAAVPAVQWKTMDGTFIAMSQALAGGIFQAVAALDMALFANAEAHRIAMEASTIPGAYNFSTGWPAHYVE